MRPPEGDVRRILPPLNSLRAFEAAGRLLSFSSAARELRVTQGAISQQIKGLEQHLGLKLFVRLTRRIELTEAGRGYLQEIQTALDRLEEATRNTRPRGKHRTLTISVLPTLASSWLMPKLAGFTMSHPNIETRIVTSIEPVDLAAGEADVAIRVGPFPGKRYKRWQPKIDLEMVVNWRGIHAEYLFPDLLTPVCSPSLTSEDRPLHGPSDLHGYPLIHTASRRRAWPDWFHAQGLNPPAGGDSIEYGHFFMSVQAAHKGMGVAIAPRILLSGLNPEGLISPFDIFIPSAGEYYLLTLDKRRDDSEIALFCAWLKQHAAQETSADRPSLHPA